MATTKKAAPSADTSAVKTVQVDLPAEIFDTEKGIILLKGAVPGPKGGVVVIRSAAKRNQEVAR